MPPLIFKTHLELLKDFPTTFVALIEPALFIQLSIHFLLWFHRGIAMPTLLWLSFDSLSVSFSHSDRNLITLSMKYFCYLRSGSISYDYIFLLKLMFLYGQYFCRISFISNANIYWRTICFNFVIFLFRTWSL